MASWRLGRCGVVERRLQSGEGEHEVGLADAGDVLRGELEVVRLGPGRGEVGDGDVLAAHSLGHELQRVGAHHDLRPRRGGRAVTAAGGQQRHDEDGQEREGQARGHAPIFC